MYLAAASRDSDRLMAAAGYGAAASAEEYTLNDGERAMALYEVLIFYGTFSTGTTLLN